MGTLCKAVPTHFEREPEIKDDFVCRKLDLIKVKGKNIPSTIYELVDFKGENNDSLLWLKRYEEALEHYLAGRWDEAIEIFTSLSQTDPTSKVMLERSKILKSNPPEGWDGIYKWEVK